MQRTALRAAADAGRWIGRLTTARSSKPETTAGESRPVSRT